MSEWFNWAVQNVTPERLQQAMGYVKDHPEELQALKKHATEQADALKEKVGGEIRDAIAEEKGPAEAQTWSQKLGLSGTTTASSSTRQKYIRFAIKHWKYSIPAGLWFFSFVMSWIWWAFLAAGLVMFLQNRRKPKAS